MTAREAKSGGSLPMSREEMTRLGWDELDILLVTGDAYVDHPAFGAALLGRWLADHGYRVGVAAQPRWDRPDDVVRMGRPRLFAGVTAGALDSMLAHYTAFRKKRHDDAYTPGGRAGARPNRASIAYTGLVRHAFPGLPVVIGGIEASMRRAAHYDFWTDSIRRSLLLDSKADLLVYGMAERALLEVARRLAANPELAAGKDPRAARLALRWIAGTAHVGESHSDCPAGESCLLLPSLEAIQADPWQLMEATLAIERQVHAGAGYAAQQSDERWVVLAPPAPPLEPGELDRLYALPFTRRAHPSYKERIPALDMVQFSITSHRGCAGGCSFCSLALHQGRRIRSRSRASILAEIATLAGHADWTGSVTDIGGPSANMWGARCARGWSDCRRASCLWPEICPEFRADQAELAGLLQAAAAQPGVRHVRVASGVRHDLALRDERYLDVLVGEFTGGQLKLAPEHRSPHVLTLMRKPDFGRFEQFLAAFDRVCRKAGREQYVIPYLISAFPGCTDSDMRELAAWLRERGWRPQQIQCFVPTPGTVATAMYHSRKDPDGKPISVAHSDAERMRQHYILAPPAPDRAGGQKTGRKPGVDRRAGRK